MGNAALPLILQELEQNPHHYWFWALRVISKEDPVPLEHRGIIREMATDWLNWARRKGLKWKTWKNVSPDFVVRATKSQAKRILVTIASPGLPETHLGGGGLALSSTPIGPKESRGTDLLTHLSKLSDR